MSTTSTTIENQPRASLIRRLMSIVYDLLLVLALIFVVAGLEVALNHIINHGDAIERGNPFFWPFRLSLLLTIFFYFAWFWTHGGQTLGMKTWKMQLRSRNGKTVSWNQAIIYFLAAVLPLGIGFLWSLFRQDRATLHDLIANCEMLDLR